MGMCQSIGACAWAACRSRTLRRARAGEEERGGARGLSAGMTLESLELEYGEDPRWQVRAVDACDVAAAPGECPALVMLHRYLPVASVPQACEEGLRRELLEARLAPLQKAAEQEARVALQTAQAGFRRAALRSSRQRLACFVAALLPDL